MIFELNEIDEIIKLKEKHKKVEEILNSRSDNREYFRNISQQLSVDFESLNDCIDSYEFSLLISCYTISEQLLKNFIYHILEKDGNSNEYIDLFINKKIDPEKFSPSVLTNKIKEQIEVFCANYKLIISEDHEDFRIYNNMIKARHQYAHANHYPFEFQNYTICIRVIEYLSFEYRIFIDNKELRLKIQNDIFDIKKSMEKVIKWKKIEFRNPKVKRYRDDCKLFVNNYKKYLEHIPLVEYILLEVEKFSKIDLRRKDEQEYMTASRDVFRKLTAQVL